MTVVTFGETMLRVFPASAGERPLDAREWCVEPGGAESNVAVALARLGVPARHVTRLPEGPLGDRVVEALRGPGVDTCAIARGGERVGVYFTEAGCGPRAASVVYDRAGSAFAVSVAADFDLAAAYSGATRLHVTGITPALGEGPERLLAEVVAARPDGCALSLDLNFRATLWGRRGVAAMGPMWPLVEAAETLFANESDLAAALGLPVPGPSDPAGYGDAAAACFERAPGLERVVVSLRESQSASRNRFGAVLFERDAAAPHVAEAVEVDAIVDRVGTGDAFAAGVLEGIVAGRAPAESLARAVALAALCHSVRGDASRFGPADLDRFLADGERRVSR